jgi:signal peptidase I
MGYNTGKLRSDSPRSSLPHENWVGDLILECEVKVDRPEGRLIFDLSKGVDRFEARWDLSTGRCTLVRLADNKEEELAAQETELKKPGTYELRFANVDERLTIWVNGKLPFGDGVTYKPPKHPGPYEGDLKPARIGVQAAQVSIDHLRLWRDTYYTTGTHGGDPATSDADFSDWANGSDKWENPAAWGPLQRNMPVRTMYVQPGHYLCMGDNSPESSDGRSWGLVPRRLLLGRALLVYYPPQRAGRIR